MDLTEVEDIKKRWQEYTEDLYKKDLHDPGNNDGVDHWPRARHPGMWNQLGLRKHHFKLRGHILLIGRYFKDMIL